jgi:dihydrofolate reductase
MISAIYAMNKKGVIGDSKSLNGLPWKCSKDMKRFKELTTDNIVLMGYNTWRSMGEKPLPNRDNWVIDKHYSDLGYLLYDDEDLFKLTSIENGVEYYRIWSLNGRYLNTKELFVIGGKKTIEEAYPYLDRLYISIINDESDGDVKHPVIDLNNFICKSVEKHDEVDFYVFDRIKNE